MMWLLAVPAGWLVFGLLVGTTLGRAIRIADEKEGTRDPADTR